MGFSAVTRAQRIPVGRNQCTDPLIGARKIDSSVITPRETNRMSFAITYTVKNEEHTIEDAILVHRGLGCERFFIFLDGSQDSTAARLTGLPDVTVMDTARPSDDVQLPAWIQKILPRFEESMDVRKRINTWHAAGMARRAGVDWLFSIDVDEVVTTTDGSSLVEALASISEDVDQVLFPNVEVIAERVDSPRPFVDLQSFLKRLPITHAFWRSTHAGLRKLGLSPRALAWYTYVFYQVRSLGTLPRLYRHPITGDRIPAGYFLGYTNHKAAVRTARYHDFAFNIHHWQQAQRNPKDTTVGTTLHYDLPSANALISKFSQRPPSMRIASFFVRDQLAGIASETSEALAREFFEHNIVMSPRRLALLRRLGFVEHNATVHDLLVERGRA